MLQAHIFIFILRKRETYDVIDEFVFNQPIYLTMSERRTSNANHIRYYSLEGAVRLTYDPT